MIFENDDHENEMNMSNKALEKAIMDRQKAFDFLIEEGMPEWLSSWYACLKRNDNGLISTVLKKRMFAFSEIVQGLGYVFRVQRKVDGRELITLVLDGNVLAGCYHKLL